MNDAMNEIRTRDMAGLVKAAILLTYWASIIFAEIMFIQIMGQVFPDGIVRYFAVAGAVMNGVTACIMPFAKDHYFAPGKMHTIGLALWGLDVAVLFLNVLLAFEVHMGITAGGMFTWWYPFSPASPLMAVVTWGVLMVLSPEHEQHQKTMLRRTRLAEAYSDAEMAFIEGGGVGDIFQAGARQNARLAAEQIVGKRLHVSDGPQLSGILSSGGNGRAHEPVVIRPKSDGSPNE